MRSDCGNFGLLQFRQEIKVASLLHSGHVLEGALDPGVYLFFKVLVYFSLDRKSKVTLFACVHV